MLLLFDPVVHSFFDTFLAKVFWFWLAVLFRIGLLKQFISYFLWLTEEEEEEVAETLKFFSIFFIKDSAIVFLVEEKAILLQFSSVSVSIKAKSCYLVETLAKKLN